MVKAGRAILAALMLGVFSAASGEAAEKNLIAASGTTVSSWTTYDWNASAGTGKAASFAFRSGEPGSVTASDPDDARFVREVAVEPSTVYRFSTKTRTENIGPVNRGAGISVMGILGGSSDVRGTSGTWRSVDFYGRTGVNQTSVSVAVGIGGYGSLNTGSAWFDDIRVEKAAPPAGVSVVSLEPTPVAVAAVPATPAKSGAGIILLVAGCGGALLGIGSLLRRPSGEGAGEQIASTAGTTVATRDIGVMAALTIVALAVSFWNLGGHIAPGTGWTPAKAGDSVTLELPKKATLSRLYYYSGINERTFDDARFSLAARDDAGRFVPVTTWTKDDSAIWQFVDVATATTALRITADTPGGRINEVAVVAKGSTSPLSGVKIGEKSAGVSGAENLIDEPKAFEYAPSYRTGFYFDEVYHGRSAWEMLHRIEPYETTHPPLGKLIIGWGISLFGMNAFGWRFGGALFGVLLVPLMYLFGLKLFRSRFHAFLAASLVAVDFMRFAQSRVAVIDIYGVFFVVLMYYFILDLFPPKEEPADPARTDRALLLAGITFGIGAACKWIALYAAGGLAVLIAVRTYLDVKNRAKGEGSTLLFLFRRFGICVGSFIVIPAFIYVASYYWYFGIPGPGHDLEGIWGLQKHMLNYHRTLKATHEFASPWWSWPLDLRPLWMYVGSGLKEGVTSTIATFGNPAIWWLTIPAVAGGAIFTARRRDPRLTVVLVAFLFQYLPWVGIARLSFIYHFFSAIPFVILLIVALLQAAEERVPGFRKVEWSYLGVAAALFVVFYPVLSALEVSEKYVAALKWLPTWVF